MGLYFNFDWWSIWDKLEQIMEGRGSDCFRNSEYAGYYDELLTEMANLAGDFFEDMDGIVNQIHRRDIPWKTRKYAEKDMETENAAWWFNSLALTLTETDITTLFYRENNFEDEESEKEKRMHMLERLPKKDLLWIVLTVCNLIIRYQELCGAWDAVKGTIDELDSRQAFAKDADKNLQEPKAAYL